MPTKYANLLNDADVRRWFENLKSRSIITATVYLRCFGLYCELNHTSPQQILQIGGTKKFKDDFTDFVRKLESEGKAGSYIVRFKKVVNSWLAYNDVNTKLKVNVAGEYETPTLREERVPSKEELDKILRMASPRGRVSIALMAFCGLRPESLGNYTGTDGLRLGDLVESKIANGVIQFSKIPSIILVRKSLSKARNQYFSFVPSQGVTYLTDYLNELMKQGDVTKDSPILRLDDRGAKKNKFLRTTLVTRDIKEAILKAGFQWRPYVLRAYFDTNMIIAESKGSMSHPYLQFLMGHKGDIEARYSTNKGILSPNMIEDMRDAYKRSQEYLQTAAIDVGDEKMNHAFKRVVLAVSGGFKREEIAELDLSNVTDEELHGLLKKRLLNSGKNGGRQKVVSMGSELEQCLDEGWEYVTSISNGRAIVRIP